MFGRRRSADPADRQFVVLLAVIALLGALWRFGALFAWRWNRDLMLNDSWYYSAQATQLTEGVWFRELFHDHPGAEHGPLTSLVLAPLSWMDDPVRWQRLGTAGIGVAVVVLVGLLGRQIGGRRVGLAAAGVAAAYPNLWMNDGLVMSESLTALLVTACLLVFVQARHRLETGAPTGRHLAGVGALIGLAALARSELALFVPFAWVLWWWWERTPRARWAATVQIGASALLVVAPWVVFNLVRFEEPVFLTTNDGTTLLGSYCDETFDGPFRAGWFVGCVLGHETWVDGQEPSVRSREQRSAALDYARSRWTDLPEMAAIRLLRMFDLYALGDLVDQDAGEERDRWASWAGIVSFWLLAPAAVWGARRVGRRDLAILAMPVASTVLVAVIFYGAHRLRTPMEPTLVVLAAVAFRPVLARIGPASAHRRPQVV